MAELKTQPTNDSVNDFLDTVTDEKRRNDCRTILDLMAEATQAAPQMWGSSIVGFGRYHYKGKSGREGEWMVMGFSPRKSDLTLYLLTGFEDFPELMEQLGKYKTGKSCLYIKKLEDVDVSVLRKLLDRCVAGMADKRTDNRVSAAEEPG
jgi:hypothetical protein